MNPLLEKNPDRLKKAG